MPTTVPPSAVPPASTGLPPPPPPFVSLGAVQEVPLPAQLHIVVRAPKAAALATTACRTVDETSAFKWSRKAADRAIKAGAVWLDGAVCTTPGQTVGPGSVVWIEPDVMAAVHFTHMRSAARSLITAVHHEDDEVLVIEVASGVGEQTLKSAVLPFLGRSGQPAPYRRVVTRAYNAMSGLVVVAKTPHASNALNTLPSQHDRREREARAAAASDGRRTAGRLGVVTTFRGLVVGRVPGDLSIRLPRNAGSGTDRKYERMAANTVKDIERLRLDRSVTRVKVLAVTASNSCGAITTIEATSAVNFDIILVHLTRVFQPSTTPLAPCAMFYLVPILTGC